MVANPKYAFIVEGTGEFPMDMLRYDECFPADTESASAIYSSIDPETRFTKQFTVRLIGHLRFGPTEARWKSFGFKVTDCEEIR